MNFRYNSGGRFLPFSRVQPIDINEYLNAMFPWVAQTWIKLLANDIILAVRHALASFPLIIDEQFLKLYLGSNLD